MRRLLLPITVTLLLAACGDSEKQLRDRATELCQYIPDHELREASRDYMTADFYAVLDTMFNQLPEHEAMDHEWLYYFVTGNGGAMADYEVVGVEQTDKSHAVATIHVRQVWVDGSFDTATDIEEHKLYMEKVDGRWLMSDFDKHKVDCIRHIAISRDEQAKCDAISNYLVNEIGSQYRKGEVCIPTLMMVYEDSLQVWGDFWVFWYNVAGDTLKCVSGGNHSGRITLSQECGRYAVTAFEQTADGAGNEASARRIFGEHYDIYQNMHANEAVRDAVRKEQLQENIKRNNLNIRYYQDYGWPAVALEE